MAVFLARLSKVDKVAILKTFEGIRKRIMFIVTTEIA